MNTERLPALRQELEERRQVLIQGQDMRLREVEQSADHVTPDAVDLASELQDFDVAVHTAFRGGAELAALDEAIDRIDRGTYGACDDCAKPIAEKRLEALPLATLCIECQREFEKHGAYARTAFDDADYQFDEE